MEASADSRAKVARDFIKAHRHSGVGGIVIGRTPQGSDAVLLDLIDLHWTVSNAGVHLSLLRRNGSSIDLGTFPAETLTTALAYASDGRVTAATILNVDNLLLQRVHLHPALVDTGIGCRLVRADEWIFDWLKGEATLEAQYHKERDEAQLAVTTLHRIQAAEILVRLRFIEQLDLARWKALTKEYLQFLTLDSDMAYTPVRPSTITDFVERTYPPMRTLIPRAAIDRALQCVGARTLENQNKCLYGQAMKAVTDEFKIDRTIGLSRDVLKAKIVNEVETSLKAFRHRLPSFHDVSGIRERGYTLDASLSAVRAIDHKEVVDQFDFVVLKNIDQATFSLPSFEYSQPLREQFTALAKRRISQDPTAQKILSDVHQFVRAQRLFRLLLTGNISRDFPLSRLVELSDAVARRSDIPVHPTPRWIEAASQESYRTLVLASLRAVPSAHADRAKADACRSAIVQASNWIANPAVGRLCSFGPQPADVAQACAASHGSQDCKRATAAFVAGDVVELGRIRQNLLDSEHAAEQCPALRLN